MKRDMDLIRKILIVVEELDNEQDDFSVPGEDRRRVYYHVQLLADEGLIRAVFTMGAPPQIFMMGLTWDGHEFLDAARNATIWARVKQKIAEEGGAAPFAIIKALASQYAKQQFGLLE